MLISILMQIQLKVIFTLILKIMMLHHFYRLAFFDEQINILKMVIFLKYNFCKITGTKENQSYRNCRKVLSLEETNIYIH